MSTPTSSEGTFSPLLSYLKVAESEAYFCIGKGSSLPEILKTFSSENTKTPLGLSAYFYSIYHYLIGMHTNIHQNILIKQRELIAEDHNLIELCQNLSLSKDEQREICSQLDEISLNRYQYLEHINQLNSISCFTKLSFCALVGALSIGFIAKVYADLVYCIPHPDTRWLITQWLNWPSVEEKALEQCPSFNYSNYFTSTALYFALPLLTTFQFFNQMSEGGLLCAFFSNPISEGMSECNRISLGILIRISSLKDRIFNSTKN